MCAASLAQGCSKGDWKGPMAVARSSAAQELLPRNVSDAIASNVTWNESLHADSAASSDADDAGVVEAGIWRTNSD
eukprot:764591-Amphidinium_carterae.1